MVKPLGKYAFAPPPSFGVPGLMLPRFRRTQDELGNQYDADYFAYTIHLYNAGDTVFAADATAIETIDFDTDSVFELRTITGFAGAVNTNPTINLQLSDAVSKRQLFSAPMNMGLFAGPAENPNVLPIIRRFMPGTQLQAIFTEFGGNNFDELSLTFHGRKLFTQGIPPTRIPRFNQWQDLQNGLILCEDLFYYVFDAAGEGLTLGAGDTIELTLPRIDMESDFEWITSMASGYTNEGGLFDPTLMPAVTVQMQDKSTGRYMSNEPVALSDYAGGNAPDGGDIEAFFPFIIPQPKIWAAGTSPTLIVDNAGATDFTNFQFAMGGRKIFEQN